MRDLLFKNITSTDKRRRIISSFETTDKEGVRSIIQRNFICIAKEVKVLGRQKPVSTVYILKERNSKEHTEKFFCRIKSALFVIINDRPYLILFMHSLKITLALSKISAPPV